MSRDDFLGRLKSGIENQTGDFEKDLAAFFNQVSYASGQYDQEESFNELRKHLEELEKGQKRDNRVFYMALPPTVFLTVAQNLRKTCHPKKGIARVFIEKPFGRDLESSRELQRHLAPEWNEEEVFRIDHYLGKEMVKNILILRFANEFFAATWNRRHVDNVQITFKEPFGTERRGGYFDEFGIIRDVMQNRESQTTSLLLDHSSHANRRQTSSKS